LTATISAHILIHGVVEVITQTGRYAIRILGHLAEHPGEMLSGTEIAAATGIPANYLVKILNQLRKRGFVESQKGWGGGFALRPETLGVSIADVIELFEGPEDHTGCVFELKECDEEHPCPLHQHWEKVRSSYRVMLSSVKIGHLAKAAST
jgi:Rrf2 family protein